MPRPKHTGINPQDRLLVGYYLTNGFQKIKAYQALHPDCAYNTAMVASAKIFQKPFVKAYIDENIERQIRRREFKGEDIRGLLSGIIMADPVKFVQDEKIREFLGGIPLGERLAITKMKFKHITNEVTGEITTVIDDISMSNKTEAIHVMAKIMGLLKDNQTVNNHTEVYNLVLPESPHDPARCLEVKQERLQIEAPVDIEFKEVVKRKKKVKKG